MLLDQVTSVFVAMVVMAPAMVGIGLLGVAEQEFTESNLFFTLAALIWAILLNKDIFSGRSVGKRQFGLQVHNNSGGPASRFQCLVRNLTVVIWPIELIVVLINPNRRLGDFIAGTRVTHFEKNSLNSQLRILTTLPYLIVTWIILVFVMNQLAPMVQ